MRIVTSAVAIAAAISLTLPTSYSADRGGSSKTSSKQASSAHKSSTGKRVAKSSKTRSSKSSSARDRTKRSASKSKSRSGDRVRTKSKRNPTPNANDIIPPDLNIPIELPSHDFGYADNPEIDDDQSGILLGNTDENTGVLDEVAVAPDAFPLNDTDN